MKRKRCLWLKNRKAKFAGAKASRKKRSKQRFLKAKGTESWNSRLARTLQNGSYELLVRVTLTDGTKHTTFTKSQENFESFRLR